MSQLPKNIEKINLEERKKENESFIRDFKRSHGVMKQTTLRTKSEIFSAWILENGWSLNDIRMWNKVVDAIKMEAVDGEWPPAHDLLHQTLELAEHMKVHPVGILCYARVHMKSPLWTLEALVRFRKELLAEEAAEEAASVGSDGEPRTPRSSPEPHECPGAPRRKRARNNMAYNPVTEEMEFVDSESTVNDDVDDDDDVDDKPPIGSQKYGF